MNTTTQEKAPSELPLAKGQTVQNPNAHEGAGTVKNDTAILADDTNSAKTIPTIEELPELVKTYKADICAAWAGTEMPAWEYLPNRGFYFFEEARIRIRPEKGIVVVRSLIPGIQGVQIAYSLADRVLSGDILDPEHWTRCTYSSGEVYYSTVYGRFKPAFTCTREGCKEQGQMFRCETSDPRSHEHFCTAVMPDCCFDFGLVVEFNEHSNKWEIAYPSGSDCLTSKDARDAAWAFEAAADVADRLNNPSPVVEMKVTA